MAIRRTAIALLVFVMANGCAAQPPLGGSVDAPLPATIQAVRANPAQYHHKFIQLRGLVDACVPWGCYLLAVKPGTIPAKNDFDAAIMAALPFDFVSALGAPAEDGSIDSSAHLMQQLYRFSEVTLVGQYDATCALGHDPDDVSQDGKPLHDVICVDHGGGMPVYRILTVHKRWPSSAGALWGHESTPLTALAPGPAKRLFESFTAEALIPRRDSGALDGEHRAFVDSTCSDKAALCICRAKSCEGRWPSDAGDLVPAPANPYQCTVGIRTESGWRFPPAWFE